MKALRFIFKQFKKPFIYLYNFKLTKLPLSKSIVLECESDMDDNPRAFYEYLLKKKYNYFHKIIWIVKDVAFCRKHYKKYNVRFYSRFTNNKREKRKLEYYLNTSKYFIFSHPYWFFKKRHDQIVIHIGHGTPIKNSPKTFNDKCIDWMPVPTKEVLNWYTEFWSCDPKKTFICGLPRNDFLVNDPDSNTEILAKLNIPLDAKTIICMPTFKQSKYMHDSDIADKYVLSVVENNQQFDELNSILNDNNIHIIVKPHPLQNIDGLYSTDASNIHYINNRFLFENKIILYKLIACTDALLTDFSSVCFDYMLLNKPIGFFLNNYTEYKRGYLLENPTEYMPGTKIYTYQDLLDFIEDIINNIDKYVIERNRIKELLNPISSKTNTCNFANQLFKL